VAHNLEDQTFAAAAERDAVMRTSGDGYVLMAA
jgi:hypothetical protein